ncbi:hypothetical protein EST38_g12724 [Candolleomyces aberdarensis]|uniref:Uncharacterized protein n=1 Tax=Candolleomyces aberdarensis TaxID=2316362 RepID=A0A4Q2D2H5_9AGAR|nr:hypothetical protein EST38_g12724 [Candolleomyces aberdarensis]
MASKRYPYPTELDSDDEGSIEYDWEDDSQLNDDDLAYIIGRLQLEKAGAVSVGRLCVVCKTRAVCEDYVTCGLTCIEKLCKDGPTDTTMCNYCHKRPKTDGKDQCGQACADKAKIACLLCKVRPKNGRYQLCGKTCKRIATKSTPLIIEIPKDHTTYEMVENKFKNSWTAGASNPLPTISKIFKIIENDDFLKPYDQYRAYSYCGPTGALLLTKVVLGNIRTVNGWNEVMSCPPGNDSVVFDRKVGTVSLNETIVYSNDAIRPVFLIMF